MRCGVWLMVVLFLAGGCLSPNFDKSERKKSPRPDEPVSPGPIRVLIVEETEDRTLPAMRPWLGVLTSAAIREYLDSHCLKVDGRPEWRWLDQHADTSRMSETWREIMRKPRDSLPWIVISNGQRGTAGPLPASEDEVLALLRKWGG